MESARSKCNQNSRLIGKSQTIRTDNQTQGENELTHKNNNYYKTKIKNNFERDNHLKIQNKEGNNLYNLEECKINMNCKHNESKCSEAEINSQDEILNYLQ